MTRTKEILTKILQDIDKLTSLDKFVTKTVEYDRSAQYTGMKFSETK